MKKIIQFLLIYVSLINVAFAQYSDNGISWNTDAYEKHDFISSSGYNMPYRLLPPPNYNSTQKYPLVIMLHGKGEGIGQPCSVKKGNNICNMAWSGKLHLDSIYKHPSFVLFPQTYGGGWASTDETGVFGQDMDEPKKALVELLTELFQERSIDLNRVYIHGLSAGGRGAWEMILRYPALFAAASPHSATGDVSKAHLLLQTPLWLVQGELDVNPRPENSIKMINALEELGKTPIFTLDDETHKQKWPNPYTTGGNPIYTLVAESSHVVWPDLYNSKQWLPWMYAQSKMNISVVGNPELNAGTDIKLAAGEAVQLAVSTGFDGYEWSNGQTTNQITVSTPGEYRVRMKRKQYFFTGNSEWTEWSNPVTISSKTVTGINAGENPGKISAYPNPFKDKMFLHFENKEHMHIKVYNVTGKNLRSFCVENTSSEVDLSELEAGMYLLEANSQDGRLRETIRIVKQ